MLRQPPRSTRTDTLFPYTSLFRSASSLADLTLIYCGKAEFGQIFRSFSLNSPAIRPKRPKNLPQIGFPSLRSVKPDRLLERETSRTAAVAHILCYIELVEKARKGNPVMTLDPPQPGPPTTHAENFPTEKQTQP